MTNNTSTFTPSTQILEAGEQAQALADAGKPIARFLSPEIQETIDGVQKIANALNSTGEALKHFGFDEAEDLVVGQSQTSEFYPIDQKADMMGPALSMDPQFDVGDDPAKETQKLQTKAQTMAVIKTMESLNVLDKGFHGPARVVVSLPKVIEGYADKEKIQKSPIEEIKNSEDKTKAAVYHSLSPLTTLEEELLHHAHTTAHDPNAQVQEKIIAGATHATAVVLNKTFLPRVQLAEQAFRLIVSLFDEDEGFEGDQQALEASAERRAAIFGSTPEILTPIDLNSSVVSDVIQQHVAAGDDLIGGQMNKGTEPYQAQDSQYAVLA